jgi:flagellar protein FliS
MSQHINLASIPEELRMASQSRLVVMMYDEIIDALDRAIAAVKSGAIQDRCNAITEAMELVAQLALAIDVDQGGEIADNLARIYKFILVRLPWVNLRNDPTPAYETLRLILPLRNAWIELDARVDAGKVPGYDRTPAIASLLARTSAGLAYAIAAE